MFNLYKGQVTKVKPSFMRNYLHNNNGAKYILDETSDVDPILLKQFQERKFTVNETSASNVKKQIPHAAKGTHPLTKEELQELGKIIDKKQMSVEAEKAKKENIGLDSDVTLENVKIPGLDL